MELAGETRFRNAFGKVKSTRFLPIHEAEPVAQVKAQTPSGARVRFYLLGFLPRAGFPSTTKKCRPCSLCFADLD